MSRKEKKTKRSELIAFRNCKSPEHTPGPETTGLEPGFHSHTCPACGCRTVFRVVMGELSQ